MASIKPLFISLFGILPSLLLSAPTFAQNLAFVIPTSVKSATQVGQESDAIVESVPAGNTQTESVAQPSTRIHRAKTTVAMKYECITRCYFVNGVPIRCYDLCF